MYGSTFQMRSLGHVWSWNILKAAKRAGVDYSIVLAKVEKPQFKSKAEKGWFVIPTWISGEIALPLDPKLLHSHTVKSDRKKIRDHKLEFDITRDPRQFEKFYHEMHVPYMKEVHGEAAYIEPYENIERQMRNSELLLIKKDGEYISGDIIVYEGTHSRLWLLGVRNGDRAYLKVGAIIAIYYLSLDRLAEQGCKNADAGWSRAFLNDGPLRYKRKLAMRITGSSGKGIALKTVCLDAATRSFLRNNPFIVEGEAGLEAAVFVDGETPLTESDIRQMNKDYLYSGLAKLSIYRLPQDVQQRAWQQLSPPLQIRAAADRICVPEAQ